DVASLVDAAEVVPLELLVRPLRRRAARVALFLFTRPPPALPNTLSLHDALPICAHRHRTGVVEAVALARRRDVRRDRRRVIAAIAEQHTPELQPLSLLVRRLRRHRLRHVPPHRLHLHRARRAAPPARPRRPRAVL